MKLAEVISIIKKADREKLQIYAQYRFFQFNKIFEKLLYERIYLYSIKFDLLGDRQFRFRKNSSTTLSMAKIHDELLNYMDQGLYGCCIYLDLSKAFDTAGHAILLQKTREKSWNQRKCITILRSYLTDRRQ